MTAAVRSPRPPQRLSGEALTRSPRLSLGVDRAVRHLTLGLAWTVLSATLAGAPAASTAVHQVVSEWASGDERPVLRRFAVALRRTWAAATLLGFLAALPFVLVAANLWLAPLMGGQQAVVALAQLALAVPLVLLSASLPAALADTVTARPGATSTSGSRVRGRPVAQQLADALRLAGQRLVHDPVSAVVAALAALLAAVAVLAAPPLVLLAPSGVARLHRLLLTRHARAHARPGRTLS